MAVAAGAVSAVSHGSHAACRAGQAAPAAAPRLPASPTERVRPHSGRGSGDVRGKSRSLRGPRLMERYAHRLRRSALYGEGGKLHGLMLHVL